VEGEEQEEQVEEMEGEEQQEEEVEGEEQQEEEEVAEEGEEELPSTVGCTPRSEVRHVAGAQLVHHGVDSPHSRAHHPGVCAQPCRCPRSRLQQ